jgi:hypothetical protein
MVIAITKLARIAATFAEEYNNLYILLLPSSIYTGGVIETTKRNNKYVFFII